MKTKLFSKGVVEGILGGFLALLLFWILPKNFMMGGVLSIILFVAFGVTLLIMDNSKVNDYFNSLKILYAFIISSIAFGFLNFIQESNKKYVQFNEHKQYNYSLDNYYLVVEKNDKLIQPIVLKKFTHFKKIEGKAIAITDLSSTIAYQKNFSNTLQTSQIFKVNGTLEINYEVEWGHTLYGPPENLSRKDSIDQVVKKLLTDQLNQKLQGCTNAWELDIDVQDLPKEARSARFTGHLKLG